MKILGICGSTRSEKISNSQKLIQITLQATGCDYELVSLRSKTISGCIACLGCVKDNVCVVKDDLADLRPKIVEADAYVIAAPNFYSAMNAVTHAFLERWYQFRHRDGNTLWGKLAVAIGVGGSAGQPVVDQIETFMAYSFIETIAKVSGQGPAACFSCGYGESCNVGAPAMLFGPGTKITDDMIPDVDKQPEVLTAARQAGQLLAQRLTTNHDRTAVTTKMQQLMMQRFKEST